MPVNEFLFSLRSVSAGREKISEGILPLNKLSRIETEEKSRCAKKTSRCDEEKRRKKEQSRIAACTRIGGLECDANIKTELLH